MLTTCPNRQSAQKIARHLVNSRLAACVNIAPGITSIYRWQGKLAKESEILLVIKTSARVVPRLKQELLSMHTYKTPEFVVVEPEEVEKKYLNWLLASVEADRG